MNKKTGEIILISFFFLPAIILLQAEPTVLISEVEFRDSPLGDVLVALGAAAGVSILPDETVTGNITCRFSDTTFARIIDQLSSRYGLFFKESGPGILSVSRLKIEYNADDNLVSLQSQGVAVGYILEYLSRTIGRTILFDPLPPEELTFNSRNISPSKLLSILLSRFPEYSLIEDADYFFIKQDPVVPETVDSAGKSDDFITRNDAGDKYTISLDRGDLLSVLDELFKKGEREYVLLYKSSSALRNIDYDDRSFDDLLSLLLAQSGGDFTVSDGTYFIYDVNRQDILKKFKVTEYLQLYHISAEDLPSLLPSSLSSGSFYKIDKNRNGVILSGSMEETLPVKNHIISLDVPMEGRSYRRCTLDYIEPLKFLDLVPKRLTSPAPLITPGGDSFLSLLTEDQFTELMGLKDALDIPGPTQVVTFKYLKAADFLAAVPQPFKKEEFVDTGTGSSVYFQGSAEKLDYLLSIVDELDTPRAQVRYKLLIIQYQESQGVNQEFSLNSSLEHPDSETAFLGTLGNILSLNFDILSNFGYLFSINLDYSLGTNLANVLADTTLYGLSGETIKFQNSSTYRYQELEVDEGGELKSTGVTQEISTGLFMDITGWVSGDDMITMEISSTLSKKGTSSNSNESSLPPTSERVINTHIRTPSGEPIIIGGLMQTEQNVTLEKTPFFGDIPLVGLLFRKNKLTEENTELVIYIVPYLDRGGRVEQDPREEMERIYKELFPGRTEN